MSTPRPVRSQRAARTRGHTLVELIVVVTVLALVMTLAMRASRPMTQNAVQLRERAQAVTEIRLGMEALLQDLGGARSALPDPDGNLHIVREPEVAAALGAGPGPDKGIDYLFTNGWLVRADLALDTRIVVARDLTAFHASRQFGSSTHVLLEAGRGLGRRSVRMVWPR